MKTFAFNFLVLGLCSVLAACSPKNTPHSAPGAGSPERPSHGSLGGELGTSSNGGGGNTINGKPVESYMKSIEELFEYKKFILPVFRKLSGESTDVMIVYLRWAVQTKPWYFVPVKLDTLSQAQIGLPFNPGQVDQVARNTKDAVYIDVNEYEALAPKDRARLLLHEMVMSARFLMKQTPKDQCLALSRSRDIGICKNEEIIATGVDSVVNESERNVLTGPEHEHVRLMTNFLMDTKIFTPEDVTAMRMRYGFHYPWDHMISNFKMESLPLILKRAEAAGDRFFSIAPSSFDPIESQTWGPKECFMFYRHEFSILSFYGGIFEGLRPGYEPLKGVESQTNFYSEIYKRYETTGTPWAMIVATGSHQSRGTVKSKGVYRKDLSPDVVDHVTVIPNLSYYASTGQLYAVDPVIYAVDLVISRDPKPRLLEYTITPVNVVSEKDSHSPFENKKQSELVPLYGQKPLICRLGDRIPESLFEKPSAPTPTPTEEGETPREITPDSITPQ